MQHHTLAVLTSFLLCLSLACKGDTQAPATPASPPQIDERGEKSPLPPAFLEDIEAFEASDAVSPVHPGKIVFVGSSSIRRWSTLDADMAPLQVLNRGFGGSEFSDLIHYADRIITNYTPGAVVVYSGDNDLARDNNKTAESVAKDFETLVDRVRTKQQTLNVFLLSIKPSPARLAHWPTMAKANTLMKAHCDATLGLEYIDVASHLFEDGNLRAEAFVDDGIHLSALGYREWAERIAPRLSAMAETRSDKAKPAQ